MDTVEPDGALSPFLPGFFVAKQRGAVTFGGNLRPRPAAKSIGMRQSASAGSCRGAALSRAQPRECCAPTWQPVSMIAALDLPGNAHLGKCFRDIQASERPAISQRSRGGEATPLWSRHL